MNYSLALELKNVGFPQATGGFYYWNRDLFEGCSTLPFYDEKIITHTIKIPTLEELIEACGDKFHALENKSFQAKKLGAEIDGGNWIAYSNEENDLNIQAHIFKQGSNPQEAVARLWLALNKK